MQCCFLKAWSYFWKLEQLYLDFLGFCFKQKQTGEFVKYSSGMMKILLKLCFAWFLCEDLQDRANTGCFKRFLSLKSAPDLLRGFCPFSAAWGTWPIPLRLPWILNTPEAARGSSAMRYPLAGETPCTELLLSVSIWCHAGKCFYCKTDVGQPCFLVKRNSEQANLHKQLYRKFWV